MSLANRIICCVGSGLYGMGLVEGFLRSDSEDVGHIYFETLDPALLPAAQELTTCMRAKHKQLLRLAGRDRGHTIDEMLGFLADSRAAQKILFVTSSGARLRQIVSMLANMGTNCTGYYLFSSVSDFSIDEIKMLFPHSSVLPDGIVRFVFNHAVSVNKGCVAYYVGKDAALQGAAENILGCLGALYPLASEKSMRAGRVVVGSVVGVVEYFCEVVCRAIEQDGQCSGEASLDIRKIVADSLAGIMAFSARDGATYGSMLDDALISGGVIDSILLAMKKNGFEDNLFESFGGQLR